jgi:hypothetical protein
MSRKATGFAAVTALAPARLRQLSARFIVFSLLAFVLTFGAAVMRKASIFEEDRSETQHRVELAPIRITAEADHRHRLPDYLPWADGARLVRAIRPIRLGESPVHGYDQTGSPSTRAPPARLA